MKTKYFFLVIITILPLLSNGQQRWVLTFGQPDRYDWTNTVIETYDQGSFISSHYRYPDNNFSRGRLIKCNRNGIQIWDKYLNNEGEGVASMASDQDENGNTVIVGIAVNTPFILLLNPCGEKLWCSKVHIDYFDWGGEFSDVMFLENGNILAMAFMQNSTWGSDKVFLFCYDSLGHLLWKKPYARKIDHPDLLDPIPMSFTKIDGFIIISGFCWYKYPEPGPDYWLRPFYLKVDSLFSEEWLLPYGVSDSLLGMGSSSIGDYNGNIAGVGQYFPDNGDDRNALIAGFNDQGQETGYIGIPNAEFDSILIGNAIWEMEKTEDFNYFTRSIYDYDNIGTNTTMNTVIDTLGNVLDYLVISPITNPAFGELEKMTDGTFLSVANQYEDSLGSTTDILLYKLNADLTQAEYDPNTYVYDSLCDELPIITDTIYLDDCNIITDIGEIPTPQEYYSFINTIPVDVFPNPATSDIAFELGNTGLHKNIRLSCFNINGKLVFEQSVQPSQIQIKSSVESWQSGIYIAVASSSTGGTGSAKFVVK